MNIKLRAKLSAYARVATFELKSEDGDQDHTCKDMTPVTPEQIDELFRDNSDSPELAPDTSSKVPGSAFIDSFF